MFYFKITDLIGRETIFFKRRLLASCKSNISWEIVRHTTTATLTNSFIMTIYYFKITQFGFYSPLILSRHSRLCKLSYCFNFGLASTLISHENQAFRKCSNQRNLITPDFRFIAGGQSLNGAFRKRKHHVDHVISLPEFQSNNSKMSGNYSLRH